jgi:hypothetical protein
VDGLRTPWVAIADLDYLAQVGSQAVKALFQTEVKCVAEAILDDKKSVDRSTLIESLRQGIKENDVRGVATLLEYIEDRHKQLKENRSVAENATLAADCARLANAGVLILDGETEDYLPDNVREIAEIVELVSERNWITRVPDVEKRKHLAEIACFVLGVQGDERDVLIAAAKRGEKVFPDLLAIDSGA